MVIGLTQRIELIFMPGVAPKKSSGFLLVPLYR